MRPGATIRERIIIARADAKKNREGGYDGISRIINSMPALRYADRN